MRNIFSEQVELIPFVVSLSNHEWNQRRVA